MAVLGRWMARMAEVVGLSRDEDKNEEFVPVSCGLMLGRELLPRGQHVADRSTAAFVALVMNGNLGKSITMWEGVQCRLPFCYTCQGPIGRVYWLIATLSNAMDTFR
jgi:hypothetical protein